MKAGRIKTVLLFAVALLMATGIDAFAQRGRGMERMGGTRQVCPGIPDLTEEQRSQIMDLRTRHMGEMQTYRDQIGVNRAQYRALMRGSSTDMEAINSNIEERAGIRSEMEKKQAEHHQSVRQLLTDEQRVWFDAAPRGGIGRDGGRSFARPSGREAFRRPAPGERGMRQQGIMRNQRGFRGL